MQTLLLTQRFLIAIIIYLVGYLVAYFMLKLQAKAIGNISVSGKTYTPQMIAFYGAFFSWVVPAFQLVITIYNLFKKSE